MQQQEPQEQSLCSDDTDYDTSLMLSVRGHEHTFSKIIMYFKRKAVNKNILEEKQRLAGIKRLLSLLRPPRVRWACRREMRASMDRLYDFVRESMQEKYKGGGLEKGEKEWLWKIINFLETFHFVRDFCLTYLVFDVIGIAMKRLQFKEDINVLAVRKILREMLRKLSVMEEEESVWRLMVQFCVQHEIAIDLTKRREEVKALTAAFVRIFMERYNARFPADEETERELDLLMHVLNPKFMLSLDSWEGDEGCEEFEQLIFPYKDNFIPKHYNERMMDYRKLKKVTQEKGKKQKFFEKS
jgi:hypothetical protein